MNREKKREKLTQANCMKFAQLRSIPEKEMEKNVIQIGICAWKNKFGNRKKDRTRKRD